VHPSTDVAGDTDESPHKRRRDCMVRRAS